MSKTEQNLKDAFAGESQANRKYLAFGEKAVKEGYAQVAKLFRAAAAAETVHAHAHLRTLKGVGSTADNLKEAISGETFEFKSMYPAMIEDAKAEDEKAALRSFTYANDVEKIHADLYTKALDKMDEPGRSRLLCLQRMWLHRVKSEPPDVCPVCKAKAAAFFKVD